MNEGKPSVYCNEGGEFIKIEEILLNIGIHPSGFRKAGGCTHAGAKGEGREKPLKVFISYAKADIAFTNNLKKHLKPLERAGDISTWYDRDMEPGDNWDNEVKRHLDKADIILFLVSPDFLNTDYILDIEIPKALKRHESGDSRVVPIILRPCTWEGRFTLFSTLLALPDKDKTISHFSGQDDAWLNVVQGIRRVIDSLIHPRDGDW